MQVQSNFPAKKLRKIRALKIRMRQLFFFKNELKLLRIKEQEKMETQTFIVDLLYFPFWGSLKTRNKLNNFFKKYGACAEGAPYFFLSVILDKGSKSTLKMF